MTFNEAAKLCHDYSQPITISVDGNSKVYLMSEKTFGYYEESKRVQEVLEGVEQIKSGKVIDGETAFRQIREKHGYKI